MPRTRPKTNITNDVQPKASNGIAVRVIKPATETKAKVYLDSIKDDYKSMLATATS